MYNEDGSQMTIEQLQVLIDELVEEKRRIQFEENEQTIKELLSQLKPLSEWSAYEKVDLFDKIYNPMCQLFLSSKIEI